MDWWADTADHQQGADAVSGTVLRVSVDSVAGEGRRGSEEGSEAGLRQGIPSVNPAQPQAWSHSRNKCCVSSQKRRYRVRRLHLPEG